MKGLKIKKGFAIVLVAALAGLVFLLGASLVAISQLQTASANYDQRVRLAKEHARIALDLAVADLQQRLGEDTSVSYTADVLRTDTSSDFKDVAATGVREPFWTAANDGGAVSWMVTKGVDGTSYLPTGVAPSDQITLLGAATVNSNLLEIKVPREAIEVSGVDGFAPTDNKTIGHFGYWVGDLGVKASYALYDKTDEVAHDEYSEADGFKQNRIRQLRGTKPLIGISGFDTDQEDETPSYDNSNPLRIDAFANDFQFRDRYGTASEPERYLLGLSEDDAKQYFHDFTPLSRGLLTNNSEGGFRGNLSSMEPAGDQSYTDDYISNFLKDAKLAKSGDYVSGDYETSTFELVGMGLYRNDDGALEDESGTLVVPLGEIVRNSGHELSVQPVHPVLTQFNLNIKIDLVWVNEQAGRSRPVISYAAGFELWNPYSSELETDQIRLEIVGIPDIAINGGESLILWSAINEKPVFLTPSDSEGFEFWRPGQIITFSGPVGIPEDDEDGPYLMADSPANIVNATSRVVVDSITDELLPIGAGFRNSPEFDIGYRFSTVGVFSAAHLRIRMYRNSDNELLAEYVGKPIEDGDPEGFRYVSFVDDESLRRVNPFDLPVGGVEPAFGATLGFSWEIKDKALYDEAIESSNGGYQPNSNYHPNDGYIKSENLDSYSEVVNSTVNIDPSFLDASDTLLLAPNPTNESLDPDTLYDVPVLRLPKQEFVSITNLAGALGGGWSGLGLGDPNHRFNKFFDRYFYSTVPTAYDSTNDWDITMPLPNSGYEPLSNAGISELASWTGAENLFVHGMFNVHSTSIDAWTALLKGCPASESAYWLDYFDSVSLPGETKDDGILVNERYLFFNNAMGAEDLFEYGLNPTKINDKRRASHRRGMFALIDGQVDTLAKHIVGNIRERVQGSSRYQSADDNEGVFVSLEDFLNSGVLQNAIGDAETEFEASGTLDEINPSWVIANTNAEFRQSTILNLIAPYVSVRSDTFLVRAYGDAVDPAAQDPSQNSAIWARAYCEAVVQRVQEKYGTTDRKFEVVAFRWLSPSEI